MRVRATGLTGRKGVRMKKLGFEYGYVEMLPNSIYSFFCARHFHHVITFMNIIISSEGAQLGNFARGRSFI